MNSWLLRIKNWQIFLIYIIGSNVGKLLLKQPEFAEWVFAVLLISYVGWYVLVGNTLYRYLPRNATYSMTWFTVDAFIVVVSYAAFVFIFDGDFESNGLVALPAFYIFFAIAHLFWFPAAALVSIENQKEATFSQYAGTAIQLFFWPIGIWFVQPRLNKLSQQAQEPSE
ncbi:hypothetical protein HHL22_16185 [Hymenobacter sp. RP-2-7]|uniref:Uncharacterized protein n=1 Tax=Hymenobacter polaris TaxID=2682546 RepID=A0A7Y0FNA4_9BACT|nr:hypothetical protein [Hymenobacter polaris]NML66747.1 hypothetical protein [Hymenobacter polaris]